MIKEAGAYPVPFDSMEQWLESVYSDGTAEFVSNPHPALNETVKIRLRVYDDAPVREVYLRSMPDGAEKLSPMRPVKRERGLSEIVKDITANINARYE